MVSAVQPTNRSGGKLIPACPAYEIKLPWIASQKTVRRRNNPQFCKGVVSAGKDVIIWATDYFSYLVENGTRKEGGKIKISIKRIKK